MTKDNLKSDYGLTLSADDADNFEVTAVSATGYTMTDFNTNSTSSHTYTLKDGSISGPTAAG